MAILFDLFFVCYLFGYYFILLRHTSSVVHSCYICSSEIYFSLLFYFLLLASSITQVLFSARGRMWSNSTAKEYAVKHICSTKTGYTTIIITSATHKQHCIASPYLSSWSRTKNVQLLATSMSTVSNESTAIHWRRFYSSLLNENREIHVCKYNDAMSR